MSIPVIDDLRTLIADGEQRMKDFLEQRAPEIDQVTQAVESVAGNPVVQTLLGAAHITPGMVTALADLIGRLDAELGAAKQAAAGQAVADAAAPPADEVPAEPAPEPAPEG